MLMKRQDTSGHILSPFHHAEKSACFICFMFHFFCVQMSRKRRQIFFLGQLRLSNSCRRGSLRRWRIVEALRKLTLKETSRIPKLVEKASAKKKKSKVSQGLRPMCSFVFCFFIQDLLEIYSNLLFKATLMVHLLCFYTLH